MTNTTWGENFPGGGDDHHSAVQAPISEAAWTLNGDFALEVARAGYQAMIHAQTEVAIEGRLAQFERVNEIVPLRPFRWGLVHREGVTVPQLERIRTLNLFVGVYPREIVTDGLLHRVWGDRANSMPPLREIQDSGVLWGLGTDANDTTRTRV